MHTATISILFITAGIIFTFMSGCVDENRDQEPNLKESSEKINISAEEKNSSYILTRDGIPLRYAIHGRGPPIIFVLGYGMTIDEWPHRMISNLARNHTVIVYNHRGVSGVHNPKVPFTIPQGAMDLHDVITQLAGEVNGCGNSDDGLNSDETGTLVKGRNDRS